MTRPMLYSKFNLHAVPLLIWTIRAIHAWGKGLPSKPGSTHQAPKLWPEKPYLERDKRFLPLQCRIINIHFATIPEGNISNEIYLVIWDGQS